MNHTKPLTLAALLMTLTLSGCGELIAPEDAAPRPTGSLLEQQYQTSPHATATVRNGDMCAKCHSAAGAWLYRDVATSLELESVAAVASPAPIQCNTCHNVDVPGTFLKGATVGASAQYNTCTNCHMGDTPIFHELVAERLQVDTHYDNPATANVIEGYVVKKASDTACSDCHNVHSADLIIQRQWARSAHGGFIAGVKDAASGVAAKTVAGVTDSIAPAWVHYNWDNNTGNSYLSPDPDRSACQRCHTATGLKNFLTAAATQNDGDPANDVTYNPASNDYSHLSGWTTGNRTSPQNEMLYCWGCHSDNAGTLRNPGPLTFGYTNGASATFPDVAGSNVCLACHTGLENGESIKNDPDSDGVRGFINSHYLTAGAQLFGSGGFEYDRDGDGDSAEHYTNVAYFKHDKIGTSGAAGTGSNGPCVGCHMSSNEKHLFTNVTKDGAGAVTAITATVCAVCHTGAYALTPAFLTTEEEDYRAAVAAMLGGLAAQGVHYSTVYPYFYTAPYVAGGSNTAFTDWAGVHGLTKWKETMGAAFNTNLLLHDPGGYAHNRVYAKRLIWDALDFIDDGLLNDTVVATIQALQTAGTLTVTQGTAAQAYLGTARP